MILTASELEILAADCRCDAERRGFTAPCDIGHSLQRERIALIADRCCQSIPGDLIEIGCYSGATSVILARVARKFNRRLVCVDNWQGGDDFQLDKVRPVFYETIQPLADAIDVLDADAHDPQTIAEIQKRRYAFAFSDDGHDYHHHIVELRTLLPVVDGLIAVDDTYLKWVREAIVDTLPLFPEWAMLESAGLSEIWLEKSR